jgi:hypothetical protein
VHVISEFDGWRPIEMSPSGDDFFAVVDMPRGDQGFKFLVDSVEQIDPSQPTRPAANGQGQVNIVTVSDAMLTAKDDHDVALDGDEGWGQECAAFDETRKLPPILPPHLRYTPLNTPPTQYRCSREGNVAAVATDLALDPEHLPVPLSVTINHVYFQNREDHVVVGVTTRYRSKFTSVVYYKGGGAVSGPPKVNASNPAPVN